MFGLGCVLAGHERLDDLQQLPVLLDQLLREAVAEVGFLRPAVSFGRGCGGAPSTERGILSIWMSHLPASWRMASGGILPRRIQRRTVE